MKNLEEIKKLRSNSNAIRLLFDKKIPEWEKDPKHYDKTGFGFNQDERFRATQGVLIWFDSHMGTYGNSSCSTELTMDSEIFKKHFLKYLNSNKTRIMKEIAASIEKEAATLVSAAEQELKDQQAYLEKILAETMKES